MNTTPKHNTKIGQHMLIDKSVMDKIVKNIPENKYIVEIGAGSGLLTKHLAQKSKKVIAIEIDQRFKNDLSVLKKNNDNLEITFANALDLLDLNDFENIIQNKNTDIWMAGNLPYHIIEPLVMKLIRLPIEGATFLTGARFANEINSTPDSPEFGKLSLFVNTFFEVTIVDFVDKKSFNPPPRTTSAITVLKLKTRKKILSVQNNYLLSELFQSSQRGTKFKNILMDAIIRYNQHLTVGQTTFESKPKMTKNEARGLISKLGFSKIILEKPVDQLSNREFSSIAKILSN